jgi:Membrane proteins related to metalloendopeptidases
MEGIKPNTNLPKVCCFASWYKLLVCFFSILFFLQLIISCSGSQVQKTQAKGVYHRVKKGENAWSIARAYNIKLQDLAEINNIEDPALIKEDAIIFIPDANQVIDDVMTHAKSMDAPVNVPLKADSSDNVKKSIEKNNSSKEEKKATGLRPAPDKKTVPPLVTPPVTIEKQPPTKVLPREESVSKEAIPAQKGTDEKIESRPKAKLPLEEKEKIQREEGRFIWPVRGSVKTRFGIQPNKTYHNWIKIVSVAGMPVKGAASGTVIFSSALKDYGETIIIRHEKEFATVYTHLNKRYVKIDQNVKKGETIAGVGQKDKAGNAYINFEIRLRGKARNPLFFLP